MTEKDCEKLVPLGDVGSLPWLPRPVAVATAYRWAQTGRRGVRLRVVRSVDGLCTTEGWLWEFFERLAGGGGGEAAAPQARTVSRRRRDLERAERELDAAGI